MNDKLISAWRGIDQTNNQLILVYCVAHKEGHYQVSIAQTKISETMEEAEEDFDSTVNLALEHNCIMEAVSDDELIKQWLFCSPLMPGIISKEKE